MTERPKATAVSGVGGDAAAIVQRIEELVQRCEALEATNGFLAAQLAGINAAWRDAIAAIAAAVPEQAASVAAMRELAAQSTGLRQHIFSEMADLLEKSHKPG